ncbi:uncharacterized protein LOC124374407 [Homalodisca vitripennis]|uniref:uncharacterized protein LOC124374407 n=1 Tax=Homalodisca vitripennis TaxID=197043 RepID=UPI001EEC3DC6|nr:uncharacterized protein LOC124374407 [Homalodisca vitripennis]
MSKVESSLAAVVVRLTVLEDENNKFREECEELKIKNAALVRRVNELEDSVIEQEQYSRVANLEIRGVPQTEKEDVYAVLESVAKALKVTFDERDISIAHRFPAPRNRRFHPVIVVQFARRSVRGEWLAAAKKTRFQMTDLHETFSPGPVFVNEHLTLHTKDLLWRCKTKVKDGSLAYAWCKDGKVFVRHTEKSRAIRVYRSVEEIDREQSPGHGK